ncbi:uncharacterized abhydrolase domain-containing protein DDB_G0269086-like [Cydia fagiglandana]|uniref:uncharacterized abhydrolase domain-containing protein DDB_G0269086-like n=1 Tax=Cydia fagiglandana TaxID=1458189 RepID=UPI002FEE07FA
MGLNNTEFETFEQQFLELVAEFESISVSEKHLRETVQTESTRAEAAEAARDAAERAAAEARHGAAAATAGAAHAAAALAKAQEELANAKMQMDIHDRQRILFEERCAEQSRQLSSLEREVQQLRPLQAAHGALQRQYTELQDRVRLATDDARSEASRLESELRRVERCASGGAEIRERARLAAAAHARERRRAAAELHHTVSELRRANTEITRLNTLVAELQARLSTNTTEYCKAAVDPDKEALSVAKAALKAERAGSARLERALAAALADNAALAASLHARDNTHANLDRQPPDSLPKDEDTKISPIDSFLADF